MLSRRCSCIKEIRLLHLFFRIRNSMGTVSKTLPSVRVLGHFSVNCDSAFPAGLRPYSAYAPVAYELFLIVRMDRKSLFAQTVSCTDGRVLRVMWWLSISIAKTKNTVIIREDEQVAKPTFATLAQLRTVESTCIAARIIAILTTILLSIDVRPRCNVPA